MPRLLPSLLPSLLLGLLLGLLGGLHPVACAPACATELPAAAASFDGEGLRPESEYPDREVRRLAGWEVRLSRELLSDQPQATARALELLEAQLEEIIRRVPAEAVRELQQVPLWISSEYPGTSPRAEYHPDAGWLRQHGRDPAMARAVEFTNVAVFERECRRMPMLALHELAHAYHHRVLGHDEARIRKAFRQARESGNYERVERRDADGNRRLDRAYALTNQQEYFAETTEAFFGTNDFFPYDRQQLERHDPAMCRVLAQVWKVPEAPAPPDGDSGSPAGSGGQLVP